MKETPISSLPGIPMLLALLAAIAAGAWIAITGGLQGGSVAQLAAGLIGTWRTDAVDVLWRRLRFAGPEGAHADHQWAGLAGG